jgi:hypothetical protein
MSVQSPVTHGASPPASVRSAAETRGEWASFAAVAVQFGLIVMLVSYFQLETRTFARLLQVTFVGFLIHHLLPFRIRLPFFAALSFGSVLLVAGQWVGLLRGKIGLGPFLNELVPGFILLGIGLVLIGICHLPIRFAARLVLIAVVGAGLAVFRANAQWAPELAEIWIILGSMFVFRLMIYLYDLKHRTAPFSPAWSIAYFFMIPNVCFPLFPLVDYKTFCATYYNEHWKRIYQTGVLWMLRGIFHLLLYRLVYQLAPLNVATLSSATDVAGFMLATYLLYLRISGQFHVIVGLLHMFGFNLPETHHLYLLASSFTDFWRRINIYWKDFIMKLFFYPAFFKLRKLGTVGALVIATLLTFFATWLLHSWQWFWIRGSFLFTWQDISFWTILAFLVLANALYETKTVRRKSLTPSRVSMSQRFRLGLQTIATFLVVCTLWTVWSSQSFEELQLLGDLASQPTAGDFAIILTGLVVIGVAGMIWGQSSRDTSEGRPAPAARGPFDFWRSASAVGVGTICLFVAPHLAALKLPGITTVASAIRSDKANASDMDLQRRGYYEELDLVRVNYRRWRQDKTPEGWHDGRSVLYRSRSDFLLRELAPSVTVTNAGALATTNPFGMRDRDYTMEKPPGTYRMLLVGASHELGSGVGDNETFENIVEDRLNGERSGEPHSKYEILNFSVGSAGLLQKLARIEQVGFDFKPDCVLLSVYTPDRMFILSHLSEILRRGIEAPPEYRGFLSQIYQQAGISAGTPDLVIQSRLQAYVPELYEWIFRRFREQCEQRGIQALAVYRPQPGEVTERDEYLEFIRITRSVGLEMIDLSPAFEAVPDRDTLILAEWDTHTNALGHQLLADALYARLVELLFNNGWTTPPSSADISEGVAKYDQLNQQSEANHDDSGGDSIRRQNVHSQ